MGDKFNVTDLGGSEPAPLNFKKTKKKPKTQKISHRAIEQPRLEGTLKVHQIQTFMGKGAWIRTSSTMSSHILKPPAMGLHRIPAEVVPV